MVTIINTSMREKDFLNTTTNNDKETERGMQELIEYFGNSYEKYKFS